MTTERRGRVAGKAAIVTGAASGIGEETAVRLAEEGAAVCVADIDRDNGRRVVERIKEAGGQAIFAATDVTKTAPIRRAIERTVTAFGRLRYIAQ